MVKCWALYLEVKMKSHFCIMWEHIWDVYIDPMMFSIIAILNKYFLEVH